MGWTVGGGGRGRRLPPGKEGSWEAPPAALASTAARPALAQAARELLLAQASDWQFIISTGAVVDYAERRFTLHCDDAERLIKLMGGVGGSELEAGGGGGGGAAPPGRMVPPGAAPGAGGGQRWWGRAG